MDRRLFLGSIAGLVAPALAQQQSNTDAKTRIKAEYEGTPITGKILELYPDPQQFLGDYLNHNYDFDGFSFLYSSSSGVGCACKIIPDNASRRELNQLRQQYWDAVLAKRNGTPVVFTEDPSWDEDNCRRILNFRVQK